MEQYILRCRKTPGTALARDFLNSSLWQLKKAQGCKGALKQRRPGYLGVPGGQCSRGKSQLDNLQSDPPDSEKFEETQTNQKIQVVTSKVQIHFAEPAISKQDNPLIRREGK